MKIGILTWGSEGDIRPFLALAGGLSAAGLETTLAYTEIRDRDFSSVADSLNIAVRRLPFPVCGDFLFRRFGEEIIRAWDPLQQIRMVLKRFFDPVVEDLLEAAYALCRENDLVIGHFLVYPLAVAAAKTGRPRISVFTCPFFPSRYYTVGDAPQISGGLNRTLWKIAEHMINRMFRQPVAAMCAREEVTPPGDVIRDVWCSDLLNLVEVSPALFPQPPDWPSHLRVCGFFNMPSAGEPWEAPQSLNRFLDAGPPPVYITFGSMFDGEPDPAEIARILTEAVHLAGCRAIIQANWDQIRGIPESPAVYRVFRTPHQHVFPRCAAVIHHCGSGTTQSAVRAGLPSVPVPYATDQTFWGATLYRKGIASRPVYRRRLTAPRLAKAIRSVLDDSQKAWKAKKIGESMALENGVQNAVNQIHTVLSHLR